MEVGKDLTAGTMAGIAQLLVGHPFDTVKVKLQSQMASSQPPKYSGAWDAVKKIMASEGPKGLYRGLGAPLAAVALFNAVLFTARGQMEALLSHNKKEVYTTLSVRQQMVAGMGAGVAVSFVACPTELIKCRLQAQSSSSTAADSAPPPPPVRTLLELDSPTLDEENKPPEIHDQDAQQTTSTETRINPSPNFEILNLQEDRGLRTLVVNHCVPDQQQGQNVVDLEALVRPEVTETQPSKYSGSVDVAVQVFRNEGGVLGFFKGLSPTFLREVFGNAAYFGSYQGMAGIHEDKCIYVSVTYHPRGNTL